MTKIQSHLDDFVLALNAAGDMFTEAGHTPGLWLDGEWQDTVALLMVTMEWNMVQIETQTPPVLAGSHNLMLDAIDDYRLFMDTYARGIDNMDDDVLLQALVHLEKATGLHAQSVNVRELRCSE